MEGALGRMPTSTSSMPSEQRIWSSPFFFSSKNTAPRKLKRRRLGIKASQARARNSGRKALTV